MLEERLSSTYAQHTLGAYDSIAPPQASQAPSNVYPSMSRPVPRGQGGADSFYLGNEPSSSGQQQTRPYVQTGPPGPQAVQSHVRTPGAVSGPGTYTHPQWPQHGDMQRQSWNQTGETTPQAGPSQPNPSLPYAGGEPVAGNPSEPSNAESYYNNQAGYEPAPVAQRSSSISEYSSSPFMTRNPPSQQPPTPLPPNHSHPTATPPAISKQQQQPPPSYPVPGAPPHAAQYQPSPDVMAPQGQQPGVPQAMYSWQPHAGQQAHPGANGSGNPQAEAAAAARPPPPQQYYQPQPVQPKPAEESLIEL